MAEKKLEKGSAEWQLFQDFWKFRQKYYEADNGDNWIIEMMHAGEKIIEKYQNTDFANFAQGLIFEHFADIERRYKRGDTH